MDNLGSHKSQAVRHAIRRTGAKLFFVPAYSPDLNPIEQVFAKLKALLRKAHDEPSKTPGGGSAISSIASPQQSAPTTSPTLAMLQNEPIAL
jgi:transposase